MDTITQILQATSIMTMSCNTKADLDEYHENVAYRASQVDAGLITVTEAITLVRN